MRAIYRAKKVLSIVQGEIEEADSKLAHIAIEHMKNSEILNTAEAWMLVGRKSALEFVVLSFRDNKITT